MTIDLKFSLEEELNKLDSRPVECEEAVLENGADFILSLSSIIQNDKFFILKSFGNNIHCLHRNNEHPSQKNCTDYAYIRSDDLSYLSENISLLIRRRMNNYCPRKNAYIKLDRPITFDEKSGQLLLVALWTLSECESREEMKECLRGLFQEKETAIEYYPYLVRTNKNFQLNRIALKDRLTSRLIDKQFYKI